MSYDEDAYELPEKLNRHFEKMKKVRSDFLVSVGIMEINIKKVIGRYLISDFNRDRVKYIKNKLVLTKNKKYVINKLHMKKIDIKILRGVFM